MNTVMDEHAKATMRASYAELDRALQASRAENARLLTLLAECRRAIVDLMAMVERRMP